MLLETSLNLLFRTKNYRPYKMLFSLISIIKGRNRMSLKLLFHFYKKFQVQYIFEKHLKSVYLTRYYNIYFIKLILVSAVLNTKAPCYSRPPYKVKYLSRWRMPGRFSTSSVLKKNIFLLKNQDLRSYCLTARQ